MTSTRRRHRPSTSAALRPAGPPPTITISSSARLAGPAVRPATSPRSVFGIRLRSRHRSRFPVGRTRHRRGRDESARGPPNPAPNCGRSPPFGAAGPGLADAAHVKTKAQNTIGTFLDFLRKATATVAASCRPRGVGPGPSLRVSRPGIPLPGSPGRRRHGPSEVDGRRGPTPGGPLESGVWSVPVEGRSAPRRGIGERPGRDLRRYRGAPWKSGDESLRDPAQSAAMASALSTPRIGFARRGIGFGRVPLMALATKACPPRHGELASIGAGPPEAPGVTRPGDRGRRMTDL